VVLVTVCARVCVGNWFNKGKVCEDDGSVDKIILEIYSLT